MTDTNDKSLPIEWAYEAGNPDNIQESLEDVMAEQDELIPVHVHGAMETFNKWGVVIISYDGDQEQFWFDTKEEAQKFCTEQKAKLRQMENYHD